MRYPSSSRTNATTRPAPPVGSLISAPRIPRTPDRSAARTKSVDPDSVSTSVSASALSPSSSARASSASGGSTPQSSECQPWVRRGTYIGDGPPRDEPKP